MVRTLLVRGMLVGIVAGLLSYGFLKIYGEPQVDSCHRLRGRKWTKPRPQPTRLTARPRD